MAKYEPDHLEQTLEEKARQRLDFEIEEEWAEGKSQHDLSVDLLVHASFGNASAFIEVLMGGDGEHLVSYNLLVKEDEEEEKKEPKEDRFGDKHLIKVYKSNKTNAAFVLSLKEYDSAVSNALKRKLFQWIKPDNILLLDSMFKNSYASFEFISEANILKFMKTSAFKADISQTGAEPIDVTNGIGGLNGSLLMHAEVHKIPCVLFLSILDSYEFTLETFNSYKGALEFSKHLNEYAASIDSLTYKTNYKEVLKRVNRKRHNIYN